MGEKERVMGEKTRRRVKEICYRVKMTGRRVKVKGFGRVKKRFRGWEKREGEKIIVQG